MSWIFYGLCSAVLWGGTYLIYELMLKKVTAPAIMFFAGLGSTIVFLCWLLSTGTLARDWQALKRGSTETYYLFGIIAMSVLANLAFLMSMRMKNATVSGLIEITYPLFTALFAWVFLKQATLSVGTFAGAMMVMAGIICISYFEKSV